MSSVLDPDTPIVEEPPAPPAAAPKAVVMTQFIRPICATCKRPLWVLNGEPVQNEDGSWKHDDARVDVEGFPGHHKGELYVEPPIKWGFLNTKGKSEFTVSQGPSKVHSGWSGGGVA